MESDEEDEERQKEGKKDKNEWVLVSGLAKGRNEEDIVMKSVEEPEANGKIDGDAAKPLVIQRSEIAYTEAFARQFDFVKEIRSRCKTRRRDPRLKRLPPGPKQHMERIRESHRQFRYVRHVLHKERARARMLVLSFIKGGCRPGWKAREVFLTDVAGEDIESLERGPRVMSEDFERQRQHPPANTFTKLWAKYRRTYNDRALRDLLAQRGRLSTGALLKMATATRFFRHVKCMDKTAMKNTEWMLSSGTAVRWLSIATTKTAAAKKHLHSGINPMHPQAYHKHLGTPRLLPRLSLIGEEAQMPLAQLGPFWAPPYSSATVPSWAVLDAYQTAMSICGRLRRQPRQRGDDQELWRMLKETPLPSPPLMTPPPSPPPKHIRPIRLAKRPRLSDTQEQSKPKVAEPKKAKTSLDAAIDDPEGFEIINIEDATDTDTDTDTDDVCADTPMPDDDSDDEYFDC